MWVWFAFLVVFFASLIGELGSGFQIGAIVLGIIVIILIICGINSGGGGGGGTHISGTFTPD